MEQKKILIIDDDDDLATTMSKRFLSAGYMILRARNGLEGLEAIKNDKPDLVILDITMPDMDGLAMLEKYKKDTNQMGVEKVKPPVIVLTGKGTGMQDLFESAGVTDYIVKPFIAKQLITRIEEILSQ